MANNAMHPCAHCATRPPEQASFNAWANERFGGRLVQPLLAARLGREMAYLIEFAVAGQTDLMLDQLAMVGALSYRLADGANADLAKLWSVILGRPVASWQVLLCLDALKTARILVNPGHFDSWVDKCGYSALGAEVTSPSTPIPEAP